MTEGGEGPFPTEICLIKQIAQFHAIRQIYRGKMEFRCGGLVGGIHARPDSRIEPIDDAA
jgi:hypothetical protein